MADDIGFLTATRLLELYRSKELSPVAVMNTAGTATPSSRDACCMASPSISGIRMSTRTHE